MLKDFWRKISGGSKRKVVSSSLEFPLNPIDRSFGLSKGKSIDRYYIENFLREHAGFIQGNVLEVGDLRYAEKFGQEVRSAHYLTLDKGRGARAIPGGLDRPDSLPEGQFDCFICTRIFQYLHDPQTGVESVYRLLKPGGVFLGTMPGISQQSASPGKAWKDYWRFNGRRRSENISIPFWRAEC